MASRKGMFAAFADDEEEAFQPAKQAARPNKAAPKTEQPKKEEKPATAKTIKPADGTGFDGVTG